MKVGILTLPLWYNYGGILQAFALQAALRRLGVDAVHIDVQRAAQPLPARVWGDMKRMLRSRLLGSSSPYYPNERERALISRHTRAFVEKELVPSTGPVAFGALPAVGSGLDAIVVGSDQVWRPEYAPELEVYFLEFAGPGVRKVAYAASFGTGDWRFNDQQTPRIAAALAGFDAVSVRESGAVDLLRDKVGIAAVQMCDPTLLLDVEDYRSLLDQDASGADPEAGVFSYVLDSGEPRMANLPRIAEHLSLPISSMMPKPFDSAFRKNQDDYVFPPVTQWLRAFDAHRFVVTDSFHGCVFSLIYNKPFVAIANPERGRARFDSLLGAFGLADRLVEDSAQVTPEILQRPIDWGQVNRVRRSLQERGNAFLRNSLLGVRD